MTWTLVSIAPAAKEHTAMKKILGIDLGKFKSVVCVYQPATTSTRFQTLVTHVDELREFLLAEQPDLVVFEASTPE
jgi:hypothetical protein